MNANGTELVGQAFGPAGFTIGFVYDIATATFTIVSDPNGVGSTVVNGINDAGDLVGFYTNAAGNTIGMLATPTPRRPSVAETWGHGPVVRRVFPARAGRRGAQQSPPRKQRARVRGLERRCRLASALTLGRGNSDGWSPSEAAACQRGRRRLDLRDYPYIKPALRPGPIRFPRGPGLASLTDLVVRARRTVCFVHKRPVAGDTAPEGGVACWNWAAFLHRPSFGPRQISPLIASSRFRFL